MSNRKGIPSRADREAGINYIMWMMGCTRAQALKGLTVIALEVDPVFRQQMKDAIKQREGHENTTTRTADSGAEDHQTDSSDRGSSA